MKCASKIGQEIDVGKSLLLLPTDFLKLLAAVIRNFDFRSCPWRILRTMRHAMPVETAPQRIRMSKRGIDHMGDRESPKTSSRTVMPGSRPASPRSRSFVAPSSSNSAFKSWYLR